MGFASCADTSEKVYSAVLRFIPEAKNALDNLPRIYYNNQQPLARLH